jgi:hypothetical protein
MIFKFIEFLHFPKIKDFLLNLMIQEGIYSLGNDQSIEKIWLYCKETYFF